jgi:hypothetical protein
MAAGLSKAACSRTSCRPNLTKPQSCSTPTVTGVPVKACNCLVPCWPPGHRAARPDDNMTPHAINIVLLQPQPIVPATHEKPLGYRGHSLTSCSPSAAQKSMSGLSSCLPVGASSMSPVGAGCLLGGADAAKPAPLPSAAGGATPNCGAPGAAYSPHPHCVS